MIDVIEVKYKADIDGYEREIKDAIASNTEFQRSVDKAQKEVNQGFDPKKPKEYAKSVEQVDKKVKDVGKSTGQLGNIATKVGSALVAAFAVDRIIAVGKQILDVTAKFQRYEAVLTNTLGDKSKAQQALQMISDFAAKTPFSVDELTSSFVKLVNQGFNPTAEEMRKLGDVAASQGKSFDQLTEAIIDAQTGEFERLKEFGIRASKEGDKVTFAFKGVKTQTDFTNDSIRNYILSLGDLEGVSGGMAAISETLGGKISNLGDSFDQLFMTIGSQGDGVLSFFIEGVATEVEHLRNVLMTAEQTFAADRLTARGKEKERLLRMSAKWDEKEIQAHMATQKEQQRLLIQAAEAAKKRGDERSQQEFNSEISVLEMRIQVAKEVLEERKILAEKEVEVEKERWEKGKAEREKAQKQRIKDELEFQALVIENMIPGVEKELALEQLKYEKRKIALGNNYRAIEELNKLHQTKMGQIVQEGKKKEEKELEELQAMVDKMADDAEAKRLEDQKTFESLRISNIKDFKAKALAEEQAKYEEEKERLKGNHKALEQLEIQHGNAVAEIHKKFAEEKRATTIAETEKTMSALNDLANIMADQQKNEEIKRYEAEKERLKGNEAALEQLEKEHQQKMKQRTAFQKTLALTQIAIDTATAISGVVAAAGKSSITPVDLGLKIAAGIAIVLGNIVQASQILSSGNPPGYKDGVIDLQGPGTSRSDSIPAMLSKGESVITADKTKRYMDELRAMNRNNFEDLITTKYVLPQLRAMQQGNTGERMAASMGFNYDDSDLIHTIKKQKPATAKDINYLGDRIEEALMHDSIKASKKWKK